MELNGTKKGYAHTKLSRKYHGNFSTFFIASDKGVTVKKIKGGINELNF